MDARKPRNITLLIANFISVTMFFLAGELVDSYGAFAGLVVASAVILAFLMVIPFITKVKIFTPKEKLQSWWKALIWSIWLLETGILHMMIITLLVGTFVRIHAVSVLLLTILLLFIVVASFEKLAHYLLIAKMGLLFGLAIFLPNYLFLQKGLETVYHNLLHYYPSVLHLQREGLWSLFFVALWIFLMKFTLLIPYFREHLDPNDGKGLKKLFLAILIICTVFLAFSTIMFVAISQGVEGAKVNEWPLLLLTKQAKSFTLALVVLGLYLSVLLTLALSFVNYYKAIPFRRNQSIEKMFLLACCLLFSFASFHLHQQNVSMVTVYKFTSVTISLLATLLIFAQIIIRKIKIK